MEEEYILGKNQDLVEVARSHKHWLSVKNPRDERVLRAMQEIDRINFLPELTKQRAYMDRPVSIGYGATCSMPSLVALMVDMLELFPGARIGEIGTGCGYHAAVAYSTIEKGKLTTIEIVPELAEFGKSNLEKHFGSLDKKIEVIEGDGSVGFPGNEIYDRIYLTAGVDSRTFNPKMLLSQLNDEGGILLFPEQNGSLYSFRREKGSLKCSISSRAIISLKLRRKGRW